MYIVVTLYGLGNNDKKKKKNEIYVFSTEAACVDLTT